MGNGLIQRYCIERRETLPLMPCSCKVCPWYIHSTDYKNCFWYVADFIYTARGNNQFSIEEIAVMENTSVQEMKDMLELAVKNIRMRCRKDLMEIWGTMVEVDSSNKDRII